MTASLSVPISVIQFWLFVVLATTFAVPLLVALASIALGRHLERRDSATVQGILFQALAMAIASVGPLNITLAPFSLAGVAATIAVLLLCGAIVAVFVSTRRVLRLRPVAKNPAEHRLVRVGPYARVRHPMYAALLLYLIALAAAGGHWLQLVGAVPLFLLGTARRARLEDRLLEAEFGDEFRTYARSTPAFIPRFR